MTVPSIVLLIGPPGAGKGTQADLLSEKFDFVHLETSKLIEANFASADPTDPAIAQAKQNWETGELVDPELTQGWVITEVKNLQAERKSIVFSSSPRTISESEAIVPVLEELYGRDHIFVFHLKLDKEESIKRNSKRRICQAHRHPIPNFLEYQDLMHCPKCGSPIMTRLLDTPETISVRYEVYLRRTQPVISWFKDHGYDVVEVEGDQPIENVFGDIFFALRGKV